jgi:stage V sporulation protein AE
LEYIRAFIVGGLICTVGQIILDNTKLTPAHILVSFLTSGVVLGGIGIYDKLVEFGGAGATVPILGFGNGLAKGAIEGAKANGIIGAFSGGLESVGGGIAAAILFGYAMALIFNSKTKN